jgi:hypothetical protein
LRQAIVSIIAAAKEKDDAKIADLEKTKKKNKDTKKKSKVFTQTVELQIGLKNYDPQKDKRFSGQVPFLFLSSLLITFILTQYTPNYTLLTLPTGQAPQHHQSQVQCLHAW